MALPQNPVDAAKALRKYSYGAAKLKKMDDETLGTQLESAKQDFNTIDTNGLLAAEQNEVHKIREQVDARIIAENNSRDSMDKICELCKAGNAKPCKNMHNYLHYYCLTCLKSDWHYTKCGHCPIYVYGQRLQRKIYNGQVAGICYDCVANHPNDFH